MTPAMQRYLAAMAADVATVSSYSYSEAYEALLRGNGLLADAWDQGEASGWSRAMRRMSDEPSVERATNPYRVTP